MTTDTDHDCTTCEHDWCIAPHQQMCDCPFSNARPHKRDGCRYATDAEEHER